jgi:hypothetical protein
MEKSMKYSVIIKNLNFEPVAEYKDIIADGIVPGTCVRWMVLANEQRIEFSLNNYVTEFGSERQAVIEALSKPPAV